MSKLGFSTGIIILLIIIPVITLFVLNLFIKNFSKEVFPIETACTADAMLCPDGTAVGRSGPNCEFAPCPSETETSSSPFEASFEIYTNSTKRIFTAAMYHNQSEDVYLEAGDPSIVHVNNPEITWQEFFDTLPFQIDEECLTTGTAQTFCTDKDGTLKFFLNGDENPNALSLPIEPDAELVVRYE